MGIIEEKISVQQNKLKGYSGKKFAKRWQKFSFIEQMANIGSEVFRMLKWRGKDDRNSTLAFDRALELIDLTLTDPKNKIRFKEIARVREVLVDYTFDNEYKTTDKYLNNYFYSFNYAARLGH